MIRKLEIKDKENWTKLYNRYTDFYKVPIIAEILDIEFGPGFMIKSMLLMVFVLI